MVSEKVFCTEKRFLCLSGFEIWSESASLTCARICQNHFTRGYSDFRRSFVKTLHQMIIFIIVCFWIITIHLSFISFDRQRVSKKYAKLVVKACSVLSCPAFVWMPFVFLDKVKNLPVYMRIHFPRKCQ